MPINNFEIVSDNYVLITEDNGNTWGQSVSDEDMVSMETLAEFIESRYSQIHASPPVKMDLVTMKNKPIPPKPKDSKWENGWVSKKPVIPVTPEPPQNP